MPVQFEVVQTPLAGILLLAGLMLVARMNKTARNTLNEILSRMINAYLEWKYPVYHESTSKAIPTCAYRFPNGQGDVGKFLDGMQNSEKWQGSYGSIYRIWSGMRPEIVITRPEHLPIVFKDSDKHSKASNNNSGYLMSQILGQCVGLISGNEWRAVRAGVEPPFLRRRAADYVPLVKKHVQQHFKELNRRLSLRSGLLDPAEDLKMLPFWVVAEIFYGELDDNLVDELKELAPLRDALFKEVISGGLARFYISRLLPTGTNRRLHEFQTRWKAFNDRAYQRALMSSCPRESMAPIVNMYELVKQGAMVEGQLLQTIDESVFANLDVTTGGLSWNLVLLAANPVYQARLAQELLGTKSQDGTGGEDHLFHKYILSNTTLLAACISESSRLRPLAAFSVPQSAPTERIIDGYKIPAGTDFIIDSYSLNIRNRAFWGADAAVYRPDRFLEKGGVELRYHFWRFGFGPRQCMGKYVADIIIRALISHVVEHYHLSLLDDEGEWNRHPEVWINHPMMQIRCVKKQRDADVVAL